MKANPKVLGELVHKSLRRGLRSVPTAVYRNCIRRDVIGLCYHLISDEPPPHARHVVRCKTTAAFQADLECLARDFQVVSYDQFLASRRQGAAPARRPPILLTFDDGYRECLTTVLPMLAAFGFPAVFFITTDFVDNRRLFYRNKVSLCLDRLQNQDAAQQAHWLTACRELGFSAAQATDRDEDGTPQPGSTAASPSPIGTPSQQLADWLKSLAQTDEDRIDRVCRLLEVDVAQYLREQRPYLSTGELRRLQEAGHTVGAHSRTHMRLSRAPSPEAIEEEIVESCRWIARQTGQDTVPFALPFSGDGVCRKQLRLIRERNPEVGLLFDRRGFQEDPEFLVHRIVADLPPPSPRSNVPWLIHREYHRRAQQALSRLGRTRPQ